MTGSVCTGQAHVRLSSAGPRSCSVRLEDVQAGDRGQYMCLLNQADLFHTDRRSVGRTSSLNMMSLQFVY